MTNSRPKPKKPDPDLGYSPEEMSQVEQEMNMDAIDWIDSFDTYISELILAEYPIDRIIESAARLASERRDKLRELFGAQYGKD